MSRRKKATYGPAQDIEAADEIEAGEPELAEDEPVVFVEPEEPAAPAPLTKNIQCIWHTRTVVPSTQTPSGTEYDFLPMQVKHGIPAEDAIYLLSVKRKTGGGCCGGSGLNLLDFFQEV